MPDRPSNSALLRPRNPARVVPSLTFGLFFMALGSPVVAPVSAELRIVLSQGEFRMGDRDTRENATRLATEAAKRNALEQVATYLESVTVVEGGDLTRDEIRSYTAGLILVLDQQTHLWLDEDYVVVTVDLTSQIDTDEVAQAILALRENESARHQLATLRNEIDDLQKELEEANQLLATAGTAEEAQQASLHRQDLLNRVQSNAMVSQAWTDWVIAGPYGYPASWGGLPTYGLLNAARGLDPANPHVGVAQQVIVMNPAAPPSSPPATQSALRQPGMRPVPLTLHEIWHTTSTQAVHLGNPPTGAHVMVPSASARSIPSLQQFLASPGIGSPSSSQHAPSSGSSSVRSLHQFLQPPGATTPSGQAPITRRLPPMMHQHLPSLVVPRGSYSMAPRGFGGHHGTGRGGYGGRGGGGGHGGGRGR
jgi:hypothetical protein